MESKRKDQKQFLKKEMNIDTYMNANANFISYSMVWQVIRADILLQMSLSNATLNFRK